MKYRFGRGGGKIKWVRVVYVACSGNFAAFLMRPHSSHGEKKRECLPRCLTPNRRRHLPDLSPKTRQFPTVSTGMTRHHQEKPPFPFSQPPQNPKAQTKTRKVVNILDIFLPLYIFFFLISILYSTNGGQQFVGPMSLLVLDEGCVCGV